MNFSIGSGVGWLGTIVIICALGALGIFLAFFYAVARGAHEEVVEEDRDHARDD
jgi:hypothetical protein